MGLKVKLTKNYKEGNKVFLKGTTIEVTPWFRDKLLNGGYLTKVEHVGNKKVETRTIKKEE